MLERRSHKRYPMPLGMLAILRGKFDALQNHAQMSIGEIAMVLYKSEPRMMGQVKDLSLGGMTFDGDVGSASEDDNVELDLLMTEQGIYLHNLPFAAVPLRSAGRGRKKSVRTDAVRFGDLDAEQKDRLRELIDRHAG